MSEKTKFALVTAFAVLIVLAFALWFLINLWWVLVGPAFWVVCLVCGSIAGIARKMKFSKSTEVSLALIGILAFVKVPIFLLFRGLGPLLILDIIIGTVAFTGSLLYFGFHHQQEEQKTSD